MVLNLGPSPSSPTDSSSDSSSAQTETAMPSSILAVGIRPQYLRPAPPPRFPVLRWVAGIAALALVCAGLIFWHHRVDRELAAMPGDQRRVLYQRTLQSLSTCAQTRDSSLDDYCQNQASFLKHFPECDAACRKLATRFLDKPSR